VKSFRWPKITRDTALFVAGLGLVIREAVFENADRPYLLMIFAGMMGLPVFLRKDEKNGKTNGPQSPLSLTEIKDLILKPEDPKGGTST